tara:strand:- start:788 stop:958 length:171 start_codon:yes stop_codon:yes gene_type:complete
MIGTKKDFIKEVLKMINKLSSSEVNKHTSHSVFDKLNELVDKVNELEIRLKGFEKK